MKRQWLGGYRGALSLGIFLVACGGSSVDTPATSGGSGNSGASAGGTNAVAGGGESSGVANVSQAGATGGGGATGGDGSNAPQLPTCLRDLFADCPLQGACAAADPSIDTSVRQTCFTSGIKEEVTLTPGACSSESKVYRANGSLCYSVSFFGGQECENGLTTWTDGTGNVIAMERDTYDGGFASFDISCQGGDHVHCDIPQMNCMSLEHLDEPSVSCTVGMCAAP